MPDDRTCSIGGCNKRHYARGYCAAHYQRSKTHDPRINLHERSLEDRFWEKVDGAFDWRRCWRWTAGKHERGYGTFKVNGKDRKAHVVSWELEYGPVPAGMELDHKCRHTDCVRPDHLEPVTHQENVMRGKNGVLRSFRVSEPKRGSDGKFK